MKMKLIRHTFGICPCCGRKTVFLANGYWLRDYYVCLFCRSIPRQRAIMSILKDKFPEYKNMKIHESSPSGAAFHQIKRECRNYSYSYFYDTETPGIEKADGSINENLENLTFADNTFDLFITQDVMEHVNRPERAFSEICRVLKRGGVHVFTTPIYHFQKTQARIELDGDKVICVLPEVYHGNPIDHKGSLVTYDWGYDIADFIKKCSGMESEIIEFNNCKKNYRHGLEADFLEVVVSRKV